VRTPTSTDWCRIAAAQAWGNFARSKCCREFAGGPRQCELMTQQRPSEGLPSGRLCRLCSNRTASDLCSQTRNVYHQARRFRSALVTADEGSWPAGTAWDPDIGAIANSRTYVSTWSSRVYVRSL